VGVNLKCRIKKLYPHTKESLREMEKNQARSVSPKKRGRKISNGVKLYGALKEKDVKKGWVY
jgi:hypothetical protein